LFEQWTPGEAASLAIGHTFGNFPQLIHCGLSLPIAITQSLNGHVEPNLVPMPEAVGYGFRWIENSDRDTFHVLHICVVGS